MPAAHFDPFIPKLMRALLKLLPIAVVTTACFSDNLPSRDRIGLVNLRTYSNGGTPVVRGQAVFYQTSGLQILPAAPQECALFGYTPPVPSDNAGRTLNAGTNVMFTIGAFSEAALPAVNAVYPIYNFPGGAYLDFAAGDSALVTIPGATGGFEAMSIKVRLAEPFTADTLPTWVENQPMSLTWQAAATSGSLMLVSMRYNSAPGSTAPNVEIACAFPDNGAATIPASLANGWGQSVPATRQYSFVRIRERIVEFDPRTRTRVRSNYEYPLANLVGAP